MMRKATTDNPGPRPPPPPPLIIPNYSQEPSAVLEGETEIHCIHSLNVKVKHEEKNRLKKKRSAGSKHLLQNSPVYLQ